MAYEDKTYEAIMNSMLSNISTQHPDLDIREGSLIYNAIAPCAMELAIAYVELDNVAKESFANTASRGYLYILCSQMGIDTSIFDATAGVFKGEFDVQVPIGSRWNHDVYNYTVTEYIGQDNDTQYYQYRMDCDTIGADANSVVGILTALSSNNGNPQVAQVTECLIDGENEKSDSYIRDYYYNYIGSTASDGNIGQYVRWTDSFGGIGNYKIFPLWDGDNTVKISILDSTNGVASSELIDSFQDYLNPLGDDNETDGLGLGVAPIGAYVTVTTATELPITVSATVTYSNADIADIDTTLRNYFSSIAYNSTKVAYMNVGAVILQSPGVASISNLKLNNATSDITLGAEQIPKLSTTTWS